MEKILQSLIFGSRSWSKDSEKNEKKEGEEKSDLLRELYLLIFKAPHVAVNTLRKAGKKAVDAISKSSSGRKVPFVEEYNIWFQDQCYTFSKDKETICIGNYEGCDIQYSVDRKAASRIACVLYLCDTTGEIALVDTGGAFGWELRVQEDEPVERVIQSRPYAREIFFLDWHSQATLQHGPHSFYLQPKLCEICLSKPRQVRFNCGHKFTCIPCTKKLTQEKSLSYCPWCREKIITLKEGESVGSFVHSSS